MLMYDPTLLWVNHRQIPSIRHVSHIADFMYGKIFIILYLQATLKIPSYLYGNIGSEIDFGDNFLLKTYKWPLKNSWHSVNIILLFHSPHTRRYALIEQPLGKKKQWLDNNDLHSCYWFFSIPHWILCMYFLHFLTILAPESIKILSSYYHSGNGGNDSIRLWFSCNIC